MSGARQHVTVKSIEKQGCPHRIHQRFCE